MQTLLHCGSHRSQSLQQPALQLSHQTNKPDHIVKIFSPRSMSNIFSVVMLLYLSIIAGSSQDIWFFFIVLNAGQVTRGNENVSGNNFTLKIELILV